MNDTSCMAYTSCFFPQNSNAHSGDSNQHSNINCQQGINLQVCSLQPSQSAVANRLPGVNDHACIMHVSVFLWALDKAQLTSRLVALLVLKSKCFIPYLIPQTLFQSLLKQLIVLPIHGKLLIRVFTRSLGVCSLKGKIPKIFVVELLLFLLVCSFQALLLFFFSYSVCVSPFV